MDPQFCVHHITEEAVARSVTHKEIPGAFSEDPFLHLHHGMGTVNSCKATGQRLISFGPQHIIAQSSSMGLHTQKRE
jgi:hypothetical protein